MNTMLKHTNQRLDSKVEKGALIEVLDEFYLESLITDDAFGNFTKSLDEKRQATEAFLQQNRLRKKPKLIKAKVTGNQTFSEFIFYFEKSDGKKIKVKEWISRIWENNKVIREHYSTKPLKSQKLALSTSESYNFSSTKEALMAVNGIGSKTADLLIKNGIENLERLCNTDVNVLCDILNHAGPGYNILDPENWPKEAQRLLKEMNSSE